MEQFMLVGRYSNHKGISVYRFDHGKCTFLNDSCDVVNPSYLCATDDKVYAITETTSDPSEFDDGITVYQKDTTNGIVFLWSHHSGNLGSCYITLDLPKQVALIANYKDGSLSASFIDNADDYKEHLVKVEHRDNENLQRQSHVHYLCFTPDEKYLCAVDLGLDCVIGYTFSFDNHQIAFKKAFQTDVPISTGPRHMCFSKNKKMAFVCGELNSKIIVMEYLEESGFRIIQTLSSTAKERKERNYPSAIKLSADGRFLYVANRGNDTIAFFQVDNSTGFLSLIQEIGCGGKFPRDFSFDLTEEYLAVANQHSDNVVFFRRNKDNGLLRRYDMMENVETPTCVLFYEMK